jgi:hypothetical protein
MSYMNDEQQCLCDDPTTGDMDSNYLLPSGKCKSIKDLILYIKDAQEPPEDVFTSGWEAKQLLDRIEKYDLAEGAEIKKEIQKMLSEFSNDVPLSIVEMVNDLYPIMHLPLAEKDEVQRLLGKYLEKDVAKKVSTTGTGPVLKNLRERLAMELARMVKKSPKKAQGAFYFISEYVGLSRKDWESISTGNFDFRVLGERLLDMSELLLAD